MGPFSGLNNRDNSYAISANQAQDLLNVDLTPGGKSVRTRSGYGLAYTTAITTSAIHGVYDFFDASGNEVSLFGNDTRLSSIVGGGTTPTVLFTNGTKDATYQCTDYLGNAYCVDSSRDKLIKTDGVTYSALSGIISTGTTVASCVTRLAMGGFSDAPSRIDFSADTDFTTWGTGSLGTSPVQLTVSAPGSKITHLVYAFGRLMWFKDHSFGYVLIGNQPFQSDWVVKTVSGDIGTLDNSSVYWQGILYFRGQDGHIYAFDGYSYQRISREIEGTISLSQGRTANSWTQTSQSDFSAGYSPYQYYVDTVTNAGNIQSTFPDGFSSLRDGTSGTLNVWTKYESGTITGSVSANGTLNLQCNGGTLGRENVYTSSQLLDFEQGTTYQFTINSMPTDSGHLSDLFMTLRPTVASGGGNPDASGALVLDIESTTTARISLAALTIASQTGSIATGDFAQPATVKVYFSTTTWALTINGTAAGNGTHSATTGNQYLYFGYEKGSSGSGTCQLDDFGLAPETATWQSSVNHSANLTQWGTLNATLSSNGGTQQLYIRASTNSFTSSSSTPSWTALSAGAVPSISTGTYVQVRYDANNLTPSDTPTLSDFTVNWFEGSATDKAYATYFKDRILWSVADGAGQSTNNRVLIYDLLNQCWLVYDLAANGFFIRSNNLYFGSSSAGYVYQYGSGTSDNGAAINSYWKSKDFFGGSPFSNQELANISLAAKEVDNSTMTVTYTTNGTNSTSYNVNLGRAGQSFITSNMNLPQGTIADEYNIKIGNNAISQPWEVFALQAGIRPRSWIPVTP